MPIDPAALPIGAVLRHSYWILLFPLLSFAINGLWLGRVNRRAAGWLSSLLAFASLAWTSGLVLQYRALVLGNPEQFHDRTLIPWQFTWMRFWEGMDAHVGAYLDPISVMMLAVVAAIAFLVNVYSMGYMREDPSSGRFFALLSLFAFSMMGLIIAVGLLQMFIFWELVGVSSYLLISFWYEKPSAVAAGMKAFLLTRFADSFFLLGIVLVGNIVGSLDFAVLNRPEAAAALNHTVLLGLFSANALSIGTVLLFTGGWGKSAMFPLHVWLPDAMEGPTPVSSIIHSATMVVAGVFLTARMLPLFAHAPHTLDLVAFLGAFTALFAAVIACTQHDIKRILAFSTLSQLGYMLFSLGVVHTVGGEHAGALNPIGYTASMFHVFTHAFFKCMLFLSAGVAIHAVHSNLIEHMGGLRSRLPWTYGSALIACLAIAGIFPFSGFFSKDEILLAAFQGGHHLIFVVGLITGGLTAFYMFRFFFLIFHGAPRPVPHAPEAAHAHAHSPAPASAAAHHSPTGSRHLPLDTSHSSPSSEDPFMTLPIVVLAIPSLLAGLAMRGVFARHVVMPGVHAAHEASHAAWLPYVATAVGLLGIAVAWARYASRGANLARALNSADRPAWYRVIQNKFYIDEVWLFLIRRVVLRGIAAPLRWFDRHIVDGSMNLSAILTQLGGACTRTAQNGQLAFYIGVYLTGVLLLCFFSQIGP